MAQSVNLSLREGEDLRSDPKSYKTGHLSIHLKSCNSRGGERRFPRAGWLSILDESVNSRFRRDPALKMKVKRN